MKTPSYVKRFEHYCQVANAQEEKLKKSAFVTAIGKNALRTLKDLLLPATPADRISKIWSRYPVTIMSLQVESTGGTKLKVIK
ncbi:hypothetical protein HPB50_026729 [Hyalomma asiaticum]|uniref:Uncharacterized protein n=1 Tax=Hyalomma asiaticum TaxID=266040 RepID=A0ACB7STC2_HYAAI|nr:hypothetical protein HPB50_026729 [Hyalomma asiaticum]